MGSLGGIIGGITADLLSLVVGLATLVVVVRGVQWMVGRREEAKVGITNALWGLTICVTARFIVSLAYSVVATLAR